MAARGQGGFDSNAGTKEGLEIWRIENMNPVRCTDPHGTFYDGDAYIVLLTYTPPGQNTLAWDLHFWLGADCSQDEYGSAALRTVELDDQLGGGPVQFREVQDHESKKFLALFKSGMTIMKGGVASAFNKVDRDAYDAKLFHVKGKRNPRCTQVEVNAKQLNEGDVFILDLGKKMYQWNGKEANKYEKFKALEMMKAMEHGRDVEPVYLDSGKDDDSAFWKGLNVENGLRPAIAAAVSDDDAKLAKKPAKLMQISDASGELKMDDVAEGDLDYSMLDENDVFLVDSGAAIFCWVGKKASKDERRKGMSYATDYMTKNNIPQFTPCERVPQSGEPAQFKALFKNWPQPKPAASAGGAAAKKGPDTTQLYKRNKAEEEKMYDLNGKVEVWRIKDFKREPLDEGLYGQFWAGDSFIVLYSYKVNTKDAWIIYFWQGRDSSVDEKGASALIAKEMDDELGGDPVQVRVVQNKEPKHFLALFKGKMIVHEGGVASGFKNVKAEDTFDTDGISLFHVKGSNEYNTRAVQVAEKASSLNSGDCFVLLTPGEVHTWHGQYSNDEEKAAADSVSKNIAGSRKIEAVEEGKESDAFWEALGGKTEYSTDKPKEDAEHEPRLFQMSCNIGHFNVEEIFDFAQDDLIPDDVMMLDVFSEVYVWIGADSSRQEKDHALETAMEYVQKTTDGRDKSTPIFRVSQGYEPPNFTQWFLGWDSTKTQAPGDDPYLKAIAAKGGAIGKGGLAAVSASMVGFAKPSDKYYSLADLQNNTGLDNVDPKKKELYLSDEDFQATFKMDKAKFDSQAKWKKDAAKKKAGIF